MGILVTIFVIEKLIVWTRVSQTHKL